MHLLKTGVVVSLIFFLFFLDTCEPRADETEELTSAVEAYFEAEKAGDWAKVWNLLAPSSEFKKRFSFEMYVEMVRTNAVRVKSYRILEIEGVYDSSDAANLPSIEKTASVRVKVILTVEGGNDSEHVSTLTFLKEGGRWYKG